MSNKQQRKSRIRKQQFHRHQNHRYRRLQTGWRKPRGTHNKMRKKKKGLPALPSIGYRTQRSVRGLHPSGRQEMRVETVHDAHSVPDGVIVRLAAGLGKRKRQEIQNALAEKEDVRVINA